MRRILGIAMMVDGALQAMGVAGVVSTFLDRSWRDQSLTVGHAAVGVALLLAGRQLSTGSNPRVGPPALVAALFVGVFETTWFNWTGVVVRGVYTAVALVVLMRKTTLPTT